MEKYKHIKRIYKNPFYAYFKKHYCPFCNSQLKIIKCSKIVNSNSPEAQYFDFYGGDTYMIGNVKFIWDEFICPKCGCQISIKNMKRIEIEQRKGEKNG